MRRTNTELNNAIGPIATFIRSNRKKLGYTQIELADRTGVGLRFLKELELGKTTSKIDKINQVLAYFGYTLTPTKLDKMEFD
jgi:y4mF family transcriptional regulator